jgi:hypothetical protein
MILPSTKWMCHIYDGIMEWNSSVTNNVWYLRFSWWWLYWSRSAGVTHCAVWYKDTNILDQPVASILYYRLQFHPVFVETRQTTKCLIPYGNVHRCKISFWNDKIHTHWYVKNTPNRHLCPRSCSWTNIKNHNMYLTSFSILYIHSLQSKFINYAGEDEWEPNYNRCFQYRPETHNERSEYTVDIYTHLQV